MPSRYFVQCPYIIPNESLYLFLLYYEGERLLDLFLVRLTDPTDPTDPILILLIIVSLICTLDHTDHTDPFIYHVIMSS